MGGKKKGEVLEIKDWSYEDFPEFTDIPEGAKVIPTTGNEVNVRLHQGVEYQTINDTTLHLQILRPFTRNDGENKILPCIVFVKGSGWMKQDVYEDLIMESNLAKRGYVIACTEIRHSGIAPFPAPSIDARNAVRYMRQNAEKWHIDPDKMMLGGDSSGAHAAIFAAMRHNDDTPENVYPGISGEVSGILDFYGAVSVMREDSNPNTLNCKLPDSPEGMEAGGINLRENIEMRKKMSADQNITPETQIPPLLIFHGTKDRTVNTQGNVDLYNRMKECGKEVQLYLIQGEDHGGAGFWIDPVLDIADAFIRKCFEKQQNEPENRKVQDN